MDPAEVEQMERAGKRLSVYSAVNGTLAYDYVDVEPPREAPLATTTSALADAAPSAPVVTQERGMMASLLPRDQDLPDDRERWKRW